MEPQKLPTDQAPIELRGEVPSPKVDLHDHIDLDEEMSRARVKLGIDIENEYSKEQLKALLKAAKSAHGSKGEVVQDIFRSCDKIPLDQETYKALGFSRLHQAAWEGLDDIFIDYKHIPGEDVNALDWNQRTPLHLAAFWGHAKVVENLLKWEGIEMLTSNDETRNPFTPLHLAADGGHLEVVKLLLQAVKVNGGEESLTQFVNTLDLELYRTALHYACRNGSIEVVKELLKCKDISTNTLDVMRYTPGLLATYSTGDHEDVVKLFLELEEGEVDNRPLKSLSGQVDFEISNPNNDFGVQFGSKDWRVMFGSPKIIDSYYLDTYLFCILPTGLREDYVKNWILPIEDTFFFGACRLAIVGNNGKVLLCLLKHIASLGPDKALIMSQSCYSNTFRIGDLVDELMHYATRIGSIEALKVLLSFDPNGETNSNMYKDYKLDINSKQKEMNAAFGAAHSLYQFAHVKVTKEEENYNLILWNNILCVVNLFCSLKEFDSTNRDDKNNTLLYYIWETLDVLPKSMIHHQKIVRRNIVEAAMMKCMISSSDLNRLCDYYTQEKQDIQSGCNALLVGATLIAALAVSGMLQPPQPQRGTGYIDHVLNIYWTCNSLSFYFAVYTMILCLKVLMPQRREYIEEELKKLTKSATLSSLGLTMTTTLAIGAYIAGEHLNGPSRTLATHSTIFGLLFLIPFIIGAIGKDYWRLFRMLFDLKHWRHIGGACRRLFFFLVHFTSRKIKRLKYTPVGVSSNTKITMVEGEIEELEEHEGDVKSNRVQQSDPSKKGKSSTNDRRGLNVDDTDDVVTTLQMVIIQVVLIGTIVVFILNLFAKLEG